MATFAFGGFAEKENKRNENFFPRDSRPTDLVHWLLLCTDGYDVPEERPQGDNAKRKQ